MIYAVFTASFCFMATCVVGLFVTFGLAYASPNIDSTLISRDTNTTASSDAPTTHKTYVLGSGALAGIIIGSIVASVVVLQFGGWKVLQYIRKRRARRNPANAPSLFAASEPFDLEDGTKSAESHAELGVDGRKWRAELDSPVKASEMGVGSEMQELPAGHGASELGRKDSRKKPEGIETLHEMPAGEWQLPAVNE